MALTQEVHAREIGEALAALIRAESALEQLLVSTEGNVIELWMVTAPTVAETERRLYEQGLQLYDRFPKAALRLHVINPDYFEDRNVEGVVPASAEEIALRAK